MTATTTGYRTQFVNIPLIGLVIDRRLLPNRRTSGWSDGRLRRAQRADVAMLLRSNFAQGLGGPTFPADARLECHLNVAWPRERAKNGQMRYFPLPDGDALNAACKGLLDAIQDVTGVNDRHIALMPPTQSYDPEDVGRVSICLIDTSMETPHA